MTDALDPVLLGEFIDESLDHLRSIPSLFIQLEHEPQNLDLVNAIFRPVHTIKGSASFFGVMSIQKLAHVTETVMDLLRKQTIRPHRKVIDGILESVEVLIEMMESIREGHGEVPNPSQYDLAYQEVVELSTLTDSQKDDALTRVQTLLQHQVEQVEDPSFQSILKESLSLIHELLQPEPTAEVRVLRGEIKETYDQFENLLKMSCEETNDDDLNKIRSTLARLQELNDNPAADAILNEALEEWDTIVGNLGYDPLIRDHLIDKSAHFYQLLSSDSCTEPSNANADQSNAPADNASGNDQKKTEDSVPQIKTVKTMRVAEESIDNFLAYVGELIVTRYKFEHLRREFSNQADREIILYQFKKLNESFTNLSENIERSIMAIRMVPVRSLTQKVPKIIRDIAASTGKDIELNIKGEDLEIDKSLLDTLEGPLIHMIRNAADHGIENSEDRVISQKSPAGKIDLIFTDLEDNIRMEIRDDGKGLDKEKLKDKAVSLGLLDEKQILTDEGIIDLLFMSGVSTAAEVTDVSGRGVGMDVVRQSVNANGGNISVSTKMGKGSVFTVELPKSVTTQIIEGLILDVYGEKYVVPMKSIVDTFRVDPKKIVASGLAGECLQREDSVLTLQRLGELFSKSKINDRKIDGYIITVEDGTEKLGLLADNILGIQQIVVKPIDENILNTEFFIGATQLGDGTVSLVINIEYLCQAPIHTLTSPHQHS